jgi:hypothetical protein
VSNLVNTADGVTPPVFNPESVPRYEVLYEIWRCHAADTRQTKDNKPLRFLQIAGLS